MNKYIYKYLKYKNKYKKLQMIGGTISNIKASHSYYGLKIDNFDFNTPLKNDNTPDDDYTRIFTNYQNLLKIIGCTNPEEHTNYNDFYKFILDSKLNNEVYFDNNKVLDYIFKSDGIILFFFLIDKIYLINRNNTWSCVSIIIDKETSSLENPINMRRSYSDSELDRVPESLTQNLYSRQLGQVKKPKDSPESNITRGRTFTRS